MFRREAISKIIYSTCRIEYLKSISRYPNKTGLRILLRRPPTIIIRKTKTGLRKQRNSLAKRKQACGSSATLPQNENRLAEAAQLFHKTKTDLRKQRNSPAKRKKTCGSSATLPQNENRLAEAAQPSRKMKVGLRKQCKPCQKTAVG
jgi:hypothetical protein